MRSPLVRASLFLLGAVLLLTVPSSTSLLAGAASPASPHPSSPGAGPAGVPWRDGPLGLPFLPAPPGSGRSSSATPASPPPPSLWDNLTGNLPAAGPGNRSLYSFVDDPAENASVMFGGFEYRADNYLWVPDDVWAYNPVSGWTNQTAVNGAPGVIGRWGAEMTYDSVDGRTLLYGGCDGNYCPAPYIWSYGPPLYKPGVFGPYDGPLTAAGQPGPLLLGGFADDPPEGGALMFGGCSDFNTNSGSCTTTAGGTFKVSWPQSSTDPTFTEITSTSPQPTARWLAAMTWDPTLDGVVLYGGLAASHALNDTWIFRGGAWQNLTSTLHPAPPPTWGGSLVYENNTGRLLLFGGVDPHGASSQTWALGPRGWVNLTSGLAAAGVPSPRYFVQAVSAPGPAFPVLYGGTNNSGAPQTDTWVFGPRPGVNVTVAPAATDVGQSVSLGGWAQGGLAPYSFSWNFGNGKGTVGRYANTSYSSSGTYLARLTASDTYGMSASASLQVTVHPVPSVVVSAQPASSTTAVPVNLSATLSGGTPPFTYAWNFGDGSSPSTQTNPSHLYIQPGSYNASVNVTDAAGLVAEGHVLVTITFAPIVLVASRTPGSGIGPLLVSFHASGTGGSGTLTSTWVFGDGSSPSTGLSPSHTYAHPGNYTAVVWVNDSYGHSATASFPIAVYAPLSVGVVAAPDPVMAGQAATLRASAAGGNRSGPYIFAWWLNGTTPLAGSGSSILFTPTGAANFTIKAIVADASGDESNASVVLQAVAAYHPPPLALSIQANASAFPAGGTVALSVNATGGFAPYTYSWAVNGTNASALGTSNTTTVTLPDAATYSFSAWVVDARGEALQSVAVQVTVTPQNSGGTPPPGSGNGKSPSPSSPQLLGGLLSNDLFLLLIIAVVVVAAVAAVALSRRRPQPSGSADLAEEGALPSVGWTGPEEENIAPGPPAWSPGVGPAPSAPVAGAATRPARAPHYVEFQRPSAASPPPSAPSEEGTGAVELEPSPDDEGPSLAPVPPAEPEGATPGASPVEVVPAPAPPEAEAPPPTVPDGPAPVPPASEAPATEVVAQGPIKEAAVEAPTPEVKGAPAPALSANAAAPAPKPKMKLRRKTPPSGS